MRLLLAGFGIAALAAIGWIFTEAIRESREWREVVSFAEREPNLRTVEENSRIGDLLQRRFPREELVGSLPWGGLRLIHPDGSERVLVFHSLTGSFAPAFPSVFVSVLHDNRREKSLTSIYPGYAVTVLGVRRSGVGAPGPWAFEMTVNLIGEGNATERHVYALIDGRPVLVRLEDVWGVPRPNEYREDIVQVGEGVPDRLPEEWERDLGSPDLSVVLRALLWLGGEHADPREMPSGGEESTASRQAHRDALARPGTRSKLMELRVHPHPWVSEAAAQLELAD